MADFLLVAVLGFPGPYFKVMIYVFCSFETSAEGSETASGGCGLRLCFRLSSLAGSAVFLVTFGLRRGVCSGSTTTRSSSWSNEAEYLSLDGFLTGRCEARRVLAAGSSSTGEAERFLVVGDNISSVSASIALAVGFLSRRDDRG